MESKVIQRNPDEDQHMGVKDALRWIRRMLAATIGRDLGFRPDIRLASERVGSDYGGWDVHTSTLSPRSVVYSFGVGEDASFDVALIDRFGMTIHAFDPTPKAVEWVARQNLPSSFRFHPVGLADYDGEGQFNPPTDPSFASYRMTANHGKQERAIEAEVRRLRTIMEDLGHDHIDLLKLDIEGAEYDAIDDMLASNVDVRQLLVEFHHRFEAVTLAATRAAVTRLRESGFRLFHVTSNGEEYSFIRSDLIERNM